jgi:hypothetical protein
VKQAPLLKDGEKDSPAPNERYLDTSPQFHSRGDHLVMASANLARPVVICPFSDKKEEEFDR